MIRVTLIKLFRQRCDITQTFLAERIGVSKIILHKIETGKIPIPENLRSKLSEVLNVPPEKISNDKVMLAFQSTLNLARRNDKKKNIKL